MQKDWESLSERVSYPISMSGVIYEDRASFLSGPFYTHLNADAIAVIEQELNLYISALVMIRMNRMSMIFIH